VFATLDPELKAVSFQTRSGELIVTRGQDGRHMLSLPSDKVAPFEGPAGFARDLGEALGVVPPKEIFKSRYLIAVWDEAKDVRAIKGPNGVGRVLRTIGHVGTDRHRKGRRRLRFRFALLRARQRRTGRSGDRLGALRIDAVLGQAALQENHAGRRAGFAAAAAISTVHLTEGARAVISGSCALYMTGKIEV